MNDYCTVETRFPLYEMETFNGKEGLERAVKSNLFMKMADFLIEECDDLIETRESAESTFYRLKLAVLTPQRYKELLQKEHRLERLEW